MDSSSKPDLTVKERAKKKLARDMGSLLMGALYNPKTVEIMLNEDGKIWHEQLGQPMQHIGDIGSSQAESIIKTVAGFHSKEIKTSSPLIEGEFPLDGSRFAGQLPPVVLSPTFAIRKKAVSVFTLEQYVESGIMTEQHLAVLKTAIASHRNILVIGGTGSGKTTLVNAIINEMVVIDPTERIFIIEDTGEIQCSAPNYVQYHTTLNVSMTQLLKTTLRMRPDRILVGEVRGGEALDLLDAWNTGHEGGVATLHANDTKSGLTRLKSLITRNAAAPRDIEPLIGEAVHLIVHISRVADGRRVQSILKVSGFQNGNYVTENL